MSLVVDEIDYAIGVLEDELRTKRNIFLNERYLPQDKPTLVEEIESLITAIKQIKEQFNKTY